MATDPLRVDLEKSAKTLILAPHGVLDLASYHQLKIAMMKAAVDEPRAVIVDLDGLIVPEDSAYALFSSMSTQLAEWPGVPLLLAARIDRHRISPLARVLPVHRSVQAAIAAIEDPPTRRLARHSLPNSQRSVALARQVVRDICGDWKVVTCIDDAVTIVNELVENTVSHTCCAPSLRLELRRGLFTIAVYDDDPTLVTQREPEPGRTHRGGLALVTQLSTAWGCSPTLAGSKVVWAVLRA